MSRITIEALNVTTLEPGDLEELAQAVHELAPDSEVQIYDVAQKSFDSETMDVIRFWLDVIEDTALLPLLVQAAVQWVRNRRKQETRLAFYKPDGTVLKYIRAQDDRGEAEDLTEQYQDQPRPAPRRR